MQKITPFLWFDGKAEQAMKFYVSIFKDAKVLNVNRNGKKVTSVNFCLHGQEFIGLNGGPHYQLTPAISFFVRCKTQLEVDDLWKKLLKGGGQPLRCGWLTDKFGVSWQIIPNVLGDYLNDKDPVKARRVFRAMMEMVKLDIAGLKKAYKGK